MLGVEKRRTEVGAVLDFSAQNYRFFSFPPNKLTKKTRFERRLIAFDRFIYQKFKPRNDFFIIFLRGLWGCKDKPPAAGNCSNWSNISQIRI